MDHTSLIEDLTVNHQFNLWLTAQQIAFELQFH